MGCGFRILPELIDMLTDLKTCGIPAFNFAGFRFPKFVFTLPRGSFKKRIEHMRKPICGAYYHAPKPITGGPNQGAGFYLDSDGMPGLRWQWCDDICRDIRHTGWFCDDFQDSKIRGIVMRLPHGRGFLAGWSMGEGMASEIDGYIYADAIDAARAADSMAETVAENEREYRARQGDAE